MGSENLRVLDFTLEFKYQRRGKARLSLLACPLSPSLTCTNFDYVSLSWPLNRDYPKSTQWRFQSQSKSTQPLYLLATQVTLTISERLNAERPRILVLCSWHRQQASQKPDSHVKCMAPSLSYLMWAIQTIAYCTTTCPFINPYCWKRSWSLILWLIMDSGSWA